MVSPRSVSAMVADMLGSPEFALIAAGLQLANLFIARIPQVFAVYFRKEGVLFHLQRLSSLASESTKKEAASGVEESEVDYFFTRLVLKCLNFAGVQTLSFHFLDSVVLQGE